MSQTGMLQDPDPVADLQGCVDGLRERIQGLRAELRAAQQQALNLGLNLGKALTERDDFQRRAIRAERQLQETEDSMDRERENVVTALHAVGVEALSADEGIEPRNHRAEALRLAGDHLAAVLRMQPDFRDPDEVEIAELATEGALTRWDNLAKPEEK